MLIFGFFHGLSLASKTLDYEISPDGLLPNLNAFNIGLELGQLMALSMILIVMGFGVAPTASGGTPIPPTSS